MESVECLVVGAGVVGLAVARALARAGREVIVVESESGIGAGISSRNSEVIYAGIIIRRGSTRRGYCDALPRRRSSRESFHRQASRRCIEIPRLEPPPPARIESGMLCAPIRQGQPVRRHRRQCAPRAARREPQGANGDPGQRPMSPLPLLQHRNVRSLGSLQLIETHEAPARAGLAPFFE
jgi:glycine/D-amino acid oxidase-like deaminating enzyme